MTRPSMTAAVAALSAVFLLALPTVVLGQETGEAEARGLTSADVQESLSVNPTEQGTLPPDPLLDASGSMPRPNAFASESAKEMAPEQAAEISLFSEGYVE